MMKSIVKNHDNSNDNNERWIIIKTTIKNNNDKNDDKENKKNDNKDRKKKEKIEKIY